MVDPEARDPGGDDAWWESATPAPDTGAEAKAIDAALGSELAFGDGEWPDSGAEPPHDDDFAVWSHSRGDWLTVPEARAFLAPDSGAEERLRAALWEERVAPGGLGATRSSAYELGWNAGFGDAFTALSGGSVDEEGRNG